MRSTNKRAQLLDNLLSAPSTEQVMAGIDTSIREPDFESADYYEQILFVNKMMFDLSQISPLEKNVQEWANVKIARMHFYRIKCRLEAAREKHCL